MHVSMRVDTASVRTVTGRLLTGLRWWFGTSWILIGIGGVIACPIMLGSGNAGGIYMLLGAPIVGWCGWAVHPWGRERARSSTAR